MMERLPLHKIKAFGRRQAVNRRNEGTGPVAALA